MKRIALSACLLLPILKGSMHASELESRFARFGGVRVHYEVAGKGDEGLVFVHGWGGDSSVWSGQAEAFPSTRVIVVDLPGHGLSDKPRVASYTLDYFARAVAAVMRDAGMKRAVLVGHSMGAPIAGRFCGLYPNNTLGLVIVDGKMEPFLPKADMERVIHDLRADYRAAAVPFIDTMLAPIKDSRLRAELRATMLATPDYVGIGAMVGMADPAAYERGPIRVPALAVLATSHHWSPETKPFLRSLAPKIDIIIWDGVSHFLMLERPREFNRALRDFLARNALLKGS